MSSPASAGDDGRGALAAAATELGALLDDCLLADRRRLARQLKDLRRQLRRASPGATRGPAQRLSRLRAQCAKSRAVCARRRAMQPRLVFAAELPVSAHVDALGALLRSHQVVVVSGETGSGKSTQLPKICLALGRGIHGRIGHTQPRRIAARAIAQRIAAETATRPGELVGHCVRFDDNLARQARVKLMTDGILLNEIHADPWLEQYDTLIVDEVHERSLNIDVLLGYLKRVLARRPDLKLIVTSATFDVAAFADFFPGSVHYDIAGRTFPVELRYCPLQEHEQSGEEGDLNSAIVDAVHALDETERGDILVFLPGEREIREAHKTLRRAAFDDTEILDLYARLGSARQGRIFAPGPRRRIILATNVAETSLTVPRVRHVIDSGLARVSRYSPRRKLQQLPVEKIARANADQRRGRCGREAPGICIRLYSEADYSARRAAVEPEILRTNLAGVILRLRAMGVSDIEDFPFLERPAERMIKDGYSVLQEIGALDATRALTAAGTRLAAYPIDPRLARVLTRAAELDCLREALIISAALSIADPRERPHEKRDLADRAHLEFADKRSDFLWFVNAWAFALELEHMPPKRRARLCRRRFLSAARMQEWVQLHAYLSSRVTAEGLAINDQPASYKVIHCALIAGFPSLVGEWQGDHYLGCRNLVFALHPGSIVYKRAVKWLLVGDIVETGRAYARLGARIDPHWVEHSAAHLIKRSYEAPQWDTRRGCALVLEIQRLYGLVLSASRQVELTRVDPAAARTLFIERGLLNGELGETPDFLRHNRALVQDIRQLEARARRRDLLAPQSDLVSFYEQRIPPAVSTRRSLLRWLREDPAHAESLYMEQGDATGERLRSVPAYLFPDHLEVLGTHCALTYRFEPAAADDGITVRVPLVLLPRLREQDFDRLVPGMLSEKVESLLRSLPKSWRRHFSPAREYAMAAVEAVAGRAGPLNEVLAEALGSMSGLDPDPGLFDHDKLEAHLRCRIEIIDAAGALVAVGRDLDGLRAQHDSEARRRRADLRWGLGGSSSAGWRLPALPERVSMSVGGSEILGYPGLRDEHAAVSVQVFDHAPTAAAAHRRALARLLLLSSARELKRHSRSFGNDTRRALHAAMFGFQHAPLDDFARALARRCVDNAGAVRDATAFDELLASFHQVLHEELGPAHLQLDLLHTRGATLRATLDSADAGIPAAAREDLLGQLNVLLGPRVTAAIVAPIASRHARYLDAIERRIERLRGDPGKDLRKLDQLAPLWRQYLDLHAAADDDEADGNLHGLFEEFRVTLFAPELGAVARVSAEQLKARLDAAREQLATEAR